MILAQIEMINQRRRRFNLPFTNASRIRSWCYRPRHKLLLRLLEYRRGLKPMTLLATIDHSHICYLL